jgi:two-component sensor histidine kinase
LIRRTFSPEGTTSNAANLSEIVASILRPYSPAATIVSGTAVQVGEHALNSIALVFHELATNAAKYGSLSTDGGKVTVRWSIDKDQLELIWKETGGPQLAEPEVTGLMYHPPQAI